MKNIVLALFLFVPLISRAQGYRGKDFWVCLPQNAILEQNKTLSISLSICAEQRTNGTIINLATHDTEKFSLEYGSEIERDVDTDIELQSNAGLGNQSLHITADGDISLYVVTHRKGSTNSYMAVPTGALGTEYRLAGYSILKNGIEEFTSQAAIVGTQKNTLVTIQLTGGVKNVLPQVRTLEFALNSGETFPIQGITDMAGSSDLIGTDIRSTKPVAFFTGHECAKIPAGTSFCNTLLEMEPPVKDWGEKFILTPFEGKSSYVARVIAAEDSTRIFVNGKPVAMLMKQAYWELDTLRGTTVLSTSKPALVAQYGTSNEADANGVGDSFLLFVVPTERFIPETTAATVSHGAWKHYLNIVVPDSASTTLKIDGSVEMNGNYPVGGELLHVDRVPSVPYKVFTVRVTEGRHLIQCAVPVAVYSYGFDSVNYDSYGNNCGMRMGP